MRLPLAAPGGPPRGPGGGGGGAGHPPPPPPPPPPESATRVARSGAAGPAFRPTRSAGIWPASPLRRRVHRRYPIARPSRVRCDSAMSARIRNPRHCTVPVRSSPPESGSAAFGTLRPRVQIPPSRPLARRCGPTGPSLPAEGQPCVGARRAVTCTDRPAVTATGSAVAKSGRSWSNSKWWSPFGSTTASR